jgi:hypothetical protein
MKNTTLMAFAVTILIGWTGLAAGLLASFAGHPVAVNRPHVHEQPASEVPDEPMLFSETPCEAQALDASVKCAT